MYFKRGERTDTEKRGRVRVFLSYRADLQNKNLHRAPSVKLKLVFGAALAAARTKITKITKLTELTKLLS
jgi:hypothetical protein